MKIAILGAGGHGRVVLDILLQAGTVHQSGTVRQTSPAEQRGWPNSSSARRQDGAAAGSGSENRSGFMQHGGSTEPTESASQTGFAQPESTAALQSAASLARAARRAPHIGPNGGFGLSPVADAVDVIGFLDSNPEIHGRRVDGLPVLGGIDDIPRLRDELGLASVHIAIGDNGIRRGYARQLTRMGVELVSAIHPSASIAQNAHVGRNTVVTAGVVICAHCQIGDSVILNTGCIIDHQSMVGEGAHICPGVRIAGRVKIEPGAFVGIGATILPKVTIGYESIVGAGAVVTEDVPDMATVVGVPAKQIKRSAADEETAAMLLPARL